jgi:hypothetical protein
MTKWFYPVLAVLVTAAVLLMLNDLRIQARRSTETINAKLPEILDKSKRTADTLAVLSEDIKKLRALAGATNDVRDPALVDFATAVLDRIESTDAVIGLMPKLIGTELKETQPAREWVVDARKEAVLLVFRAHSREELLDRLGKNKYGSDWYIQPKGKNPVTLSQWVKENLPAAATTQPAR